MMDDFWTESILYTIWASFQKMQDSTRAMNIEVIILNDKGNRRFLQWPNLSLLPLMDTPHDENQRKGEMVLVELPYSSCDEN